MQTPKNIDIPTLEEKQTATSKGKFKSAKKIPPSKPKSSSITKISSTASDTGSNHINFITNSRYDTTHASRLMTPIEAKRKNARLYGQTDNIALRKKRKPTRHLKIKQAPLVPTAPKDAVTIKKNWILTQMRQHLECLDIPLVVATLIMCCAGLLSVYSATLTMQSLKFVIIQAAAVVFGFGVMTLLSIADYRSLTKHYRTVIILNAAMLVITYIFGSSVTETSNANWIDLGFIKIQPSEFSKLLFIYSFAVHLSFVKDKINKFSTFVTIFIHASLIFGLVLLQKDLGSFTIFLMIFIAMCFAAGLSVWYYIAGGAAVVAASPFVWKLLSQYQKDRILLCFDSSIDPNGTGIRYQQLRSQIAIGNGGVHGTGFTQGTLTQSPGSSLPAKHTDMIFSTVCEEWGFIGALLVLTAIIYLIYRIVKLALTCDNPTGQLICVGVAAMLITQIIENVGMCLGLMPVIGITFPFLSYGGSSMLSTFIAIGMVLSVGAHRERSFFS